MNAVLEKLHLKSNEEGVSLKEPSEDDLDSLRKTYETEKQGQVFAFFDKLTKSEKAALFEQLSDIDPKRINEITHKALNPPEKDKSHVRLEPLTESATASILDSNSEDIERWYQSGLDFVADGKVAVVLMAGGQGTRLGSSAPKGCFNVGLPSEKSLFQIQAERIWKVQQLAEKKHGKKNVVIPWYVMTSGPTRQPTEKFFQEHNYFGLGENDVTIFEQGTLPCISNDGTMLLETTSRVFAYTPNHNRNKLTRICR